MRELQKRRKVKKIFYSKPAVVVLFVVAFLLSKATWNVYETYRVSSANAELSREMLASLKRKEEFLNAEIQRLGTNKGIEEEIRSRFNVSKEGESLIVIVEDKDEKIIIEQEEGWWTKTLRFLRIRKD